MTEPDANKTNLTRQRIILLIFLGLALLISLSTIFGGLQNYQALYEAGHKDILGQTAGEQPAKAPSPGN